MLAHIRTTDGITIMVHDRPVHVAYDDKNYMNIVSALNAGAEDDIISDMITAVRREVERVCKLSHNIEYSGGIVRYMGKPMSGYAIDKLVDLVSAGKDSTALTNFLEKLQLNPSNQTVENLYLFLEYGKIPVNKDGNFLVYKAVREDFKDIHSGTFFNRIGDICEMQRRAVNDDRQQTCSHGLHVCSFEYLPHFAHVGGHVMVCEVDPSDVVSIPVDYNNTKMRVCRYKVVGEVAEYYTEHRDVLADLQVWDEEYEIQGRGNKAESWQTIDTYDDAEDAIERAKEELAIGYDVDGDDWGEVRVLNSSGVTMWRSDREET